MYLARSGSFSPTFVISFFAYFAKYSLKSFFVETATHSWSLLAATISGMRTLFASASSPSAAASSDQGIIDGRIFDNVLSCHVPKDATFVLFHFVHISEDVEVCISDLTLNISDYM